MSSKALHRSKRSQYSAQTMRMAYDSVQSGQYTGRQTAAVFKVPYGTLNKKLSGIEHIVGQGAGRPLEVGAEKEQQLADYLFVSGRCSHGLSHREILELTGEFLREENIKTRWLNGIPGFDWLKNFLKRHPRVMARKDGVLPVNPLDVYGFYQDLEHLYEEEKVNSNEAHRFYSLLQISLQCEEQLNNLEILGNDQLKASVLTCICADGNKLPPLVVFQGECMTTCENKKDCIGALNKNSVERTLFCYWFENIFIPMLPRSKKSTILFFEGESLQINLRILKLAKKNRVFFVKFPPKLANLFQPLDLKCSCALKSVHNKHLQICNKKTLQNVEDIQTEIIGNIIGTTWEKSAKKNIITQGFEGTGLFPLDKSKFDENLFSEPPLKKNKQWKEPGSVKRTIGDLKPGTNEFETSANSTDLHTLKITHVASVASKDAASSQYNIPKSSKGSFLNQVPNVVLNESSKIKEKEVSLNGKELSIGEMMQDGAIAESVELNNYIDIRRSERIFKLDTSGGAKTSSIRKTI